MESLGGLIGASVLFGLAHAASWTYLLYAATIGALLSWLTYGWPGLPFPAEAPNLLRPIIAHAVYDYIAFLWIVRDYRSQHRDA